MEVGYLIRAGRDGWVVDFILVLILGLGLGPIGNGNGIVAVAGIAGFLGGAVP